MTENCCDVLLQNTFHRSIEHFSRAQNVFFETCQNRQNCLIQKPTDARGEGEEETTCKSQERSGPRGRETLRRSVWKRASAMSTAATFPTARPVKWCVNIRRVPDPNYHPCQIPLLPTSSPFTVTSHTKTYPPPLLHFSPVFIVER